MEFQLIDKELIPTLHFPKSEVLEDKVGVDNRKNELEWSFFKFINLE